MIMCVSGWSGKKTLRWCIGEKSGWILPRISNRSFEWMELWEPFVG